MENCPTLPGWNVIPPCNHRVKSVPAGQVEISSRPPEISSRRGVGGGDWQKWDFIGRRGWVSECSGHPTFFFIKENWICAMTRHHAEPNINILLTRNVPFGSSVRQWSHPLMIPMCCLWAKSNNLNLTWLGFVFVLIWFVYMHGAVAFL